MYFVFQLAARVQIIFDPECQTDTCQVLSSAFVTSLLKACVCVITACLCQNTYDNNHNNNNNNNNNTVKQHNEGKREQIKEEI